MENQSRSSSHKKASGSTLGSEILKYVYFTLIILFSISREIFILTDQKVLWKWYTQYHWHLGSQPIMQFTKTETEAETEQKPQSRRPLSEPLPSPPGTYNFLCRTDRPFLCSSLKEFGMVKCLETQSSSGWKDEGQCRSSQNWNLQTQGGF